MKRYLFLCTALWVSLWASAQATDLVVDCQTPGWLSSKINYGDQQTVKNLKVTGYINSDDLVFIGTLISSNNLDGELDLSECNIVGATSDKDNILVGLKASGSLKKYSIPKSVKKASNCLVGIKVDSLWFDCDIKYLNQEMLGEMPSVLIAGNSIDSIPNNAFHQYSNLRQKVEGLESVVLTGNVYYIGDRAFPYIKSINFSDLKNLRYLGRNAFSYSAPGGDHQGYYMPDTIKVPKSLENIYYLFSFSVRNGQHIFIDNNINKVSGMSWKGIGGSDAASYTQASLHIHFNKSTPPSLIDYSGLSSSGNGFENSTIYVPKGAKKAYLNSNWKKATIIELNPVETVTLNEHQLTMNKEEQFSLSVTITPEDADDKTIAWTSENESVATVDENGVVTAIKDGETKIYVTSVATGIQDFCTVLVRKNVTSITLKEDQITLGNLADTKQLVATILPEDATDKSVTWSSANEQVCTVSATGLVTATGIGSTLVTVTTVDGGLTANCVVKVLQHVDGLTLNKTDLSLKVGESEKLQPTITPSNADNKKVVWTSSNDNVAKVDAEGNVTAVKAGKVTVTATSEDNSEVKATCAVTVIQPATGITLSESTYKLKAIGESIQLTATVLPDDATNKKVNWNCPNNTVCVVSNGNVVAVGYGTAVVIATTEDGGFIATCTITVENSTGIVEVRDSINDSYPTYDTMGRKVRELKKGKLYIKQGKKFMVK